MLDTPNLNIYAENKIVSKKRLDKQGQIWYYVTIMVKQQEIELIREFNAKYHYLTAEALIAKYKEVFVEVPAKSAKRKRKYKRWYRPVKSKGKATEHIGTRKLNEAYAKWHKGIIDAGQAVAQKAGTEADHCEVW